MPVYPALLLSSVSDTTLFNPRYAAWAWAAVSRFVFSATVGKPHCCRYWFNELKIVSCALFAANCGVPTLPLVVVVALDVFPAPVDELFVPDDESLPPPPPPHAARASVAAKAKAVTAEMFCCFISVVLIFRFIAAPHART
ncbi:membrane hypothetical protein [Paraburkholderia tropica]|nr:membrane hypothetical protein [Paraburkholderia tropica]